MLGTDDVCTAAVVPQHDLNLVECGLGTVLAGVAQDTSVVVMLHSWAWTRRQGGEVAADTCVKWDMGCTSCGSFLTSPLSGQLGSADSQIISTIFLTF